MAKTFFYVAPGATEIFEIEERYNIFDDLEQDGCYCSYDRSDCEAHIEAEAAYKAMKAIKLYDVLHVTALNATVTVNFIDLDRDVIEPMTASVDFILSHVNGELLDKPLASQYVNEGVLTFDVRVTDGEDYPF